MHLTRSEATTKLPIQRKGTKYIARARGSLRNSVPIVVAVRDMLNLARTMKEAEYMVRNKLLSLNGRHVRDVHESINLFSILSAGKNYKLSLNSSGKFNFEEIKDSESRPCKIIGKKSQKKGAIQFNLHDGTNILSKEKLNVGETIYINKEGKILSRVPLEKGNECIIIAGKYSGHKGKIEAKNTGIIQVNLKKDDKKVSLREEIVFAI